MGTHNSKTKKRLNAADLLMTNEERAAKEKAEEELRLALLNKKAKTFDIIISIFGDEWGKMASILGWSIAPHAHNPEFHRGAMAIFLQIAPHLMGIDEKTDEQIINLLSGNFVSWDKED